MTESEYRLAEKLQRFLSEEDVCDLFEEVKQVYVRQWEEARTTYDREYFWNMVHALGDVRVAMQACADRKEFEDHQALDKS